MEEADLKHPNRYDYLQMNGSESRVQIEQRMNNTAQNPFGTNRASPFESAPSVGQTSSPFGRPAGATFGQPTLGATASAFGQPSQPTAFGGAGAFGKPAFGNPGLGPGSGTTQLSQASAFGQASQPSSAFGQASQIQSAFGRPSTASPFPTTAPGQTGPENPFAAPTARTGFGIGASSASGFSQASFGQTTQSSSPFGQGGVPASTFGQPAASGQTGSFGQPAFGQSSQISTGGFSQRSQINPPPFGSTGANGQNPFGQPAKAGNAFGPTITGSTNPFSLASKPSNPPFGQTQTLTSSRDASPFSQTAFGAPSTTPFSQPANDGRQNPFGVKATTTSNPFGVPSIPMGISPTNTSIPGGAQDARKASIPDTNLPSNAATADLTNNLAALSTGGPHPLTGKPTAPVHITEQLRQMAPTFGNDRKLISFRGQRVQYLEEVPCYEKPDRSGSEKVWFPNGPTTTDVMYLNQPDAVQDLQAADDAYTDDVKEKYTVLFETGGFGRGGVPLVPPRREWCVYDF